MTKTITESFNASIINKNFDEIYNVICNLYDRWIEECVYEDIKDYLIPVYSVLKKVFPNVDFEGKVKMGKRPFGFKFDVDNYTLKDGRKVAGTILMSVKGWKFEAKKIILKAA